MHSGTHAHAHTPHCPRIGIFCSYKSSADGNKAEQQQGASLDAGTPPAMEPTFIFEQGLVCSCACLLLVFIADRFGWRMEGGVTQVQSQLGGGSVLRCLIDWWMDCTEAPVSGWGAADRHTELGSQG